ncbi:hypothetical protein L345_12347, partial [Ophiophagus hannah]
MTIFHTYDCCSVLTDTRGQARRCKFESHPCGTGFVNEALKGCAGLGQNRPFDLDALRNASSPTLTQVGWRLCYLGWLPAVSQADSGYFDPALEYCWVRSDFGRRRWQLAPRWRNATAPSWTSLLPARPPKTTRPVAVTRVDFPALGSQDGVGRCPGAVDQQALLTRTRVARVGPHGPGLRLGDGAHDERTALPLRLAVHLRHAVEIDQVAEPQGGEVQPWVLLLVGVLDGDADVHVVRGPGVVVVLPLPHHPFAGSRRRVVKIPPDRAHGPCKRKETTKSASPTPHPSRGLYTISPFKEGRREREGEKRGIKGRE